jgi:hypothetical protein
LTLTGNAPGPCPAGGTHDHSGRFDYTLTNFGQDRTFLIQADWRPGHAFVDSMLNVRIVIVSFDSNASLATVTIGDAAMLSPAPKFLAPRTLAAESRSSIVVATTAPIFDHRTAGKCRYVRIRSGDVTGVVEQPCGSRTQTACNLTMLRSRDLRLGLPHAHISRASSVCSISSTDWTPSAP